MKVVFASFLAMLSMNAYSICSSENLSSMALKYRAVRSWMGSASSNAFDLTTGNGCGQHYQNGSIYLHPCIGAVEIHGLIRQRWANQGWEKGFLGYPTSDELKTADGIGRYSTFQGGAIYYHPQHGTHIITPEFYRQWQDQGGISGLGYPIAERKRHFGIDICSQSFQNGTLSKKIGVTASNVDLRSEIARRSIAIRNQASRLTCSVHTITFLLEYAYTAACGLGKYNNLSEEYLNHVTNIATNRTDDGDFFHNIITGYNTYGMVKETVVPFDENSYDFNSFLLSANSETAGKKLLKAKTLPIKTIKANSTPMGLSNDEFNSIISALDRGVPVGLGRGHSMVIVGYRKDNNLPGGGNFIFRNSYGLQTGTNGYQEESFESVKNTANDAVLIETSIQ